MVAPIDFKIDCQLSVLAGRETAGKGREFV